MSHQHLISLTSENSNLCPEDFQVNLNLHCPSCAGEEFNVIPLSGKDGEYFVRIICFLARNIYILLELLVF